MVYLEGKLPPSIQKGLVFDIACGPVPGEMHLAAGQVRVAVSVCAHLPDADTVMGTHRPPHFAIAKGEPLDRMTAEILGKVTGLGRGKGGHMRLFDPQRCFSCSGIVGASLPRACGAVPAARMTDRKTISVAFFGEGAGHLPRVTEPGRRLRLRGQQLGDPRLEGQDHRRTVRRTACGHLRHRRSFHCRQRCRGGV